jgi:hypothetical protein
MRWVTLALDTFPLSELLRMAESAMGHFLPGGGVEPIHHQPPRSPSHLKQPPHRDATTSSWHLPLMWCLLVLHRCLKMKSTAPPPSPEVEDECLTPEVLLHVAYEVVSQLDKAEESMLLSLEEHSLPDFLVEQISAP